MEANDAQVADNISAKRNGSLAGWHNLVVQVSGGRAIYYLDGAVFANHGGKYYPETPMSINLNHWFIAGGQVAGRTPRAYVEQIDYVYFSRNEVVAPAAITSRVQAFRANSVGWKDTVSP